MEELPCITCKGIRTHSLCTNRVCPGEPRREHYHCDDCDGIYEKPAGARPPGNPTNEH